MHRAKARWAARKDPKRPRTGGGEADGGEEEKEDDVEDERAEAALSEGYAAAGVCPLELGVAC